MHLKIAVCLLGPDSRRPTAAPCRTLTDQLTAALRIQQVLGVAFKTFISLLFMSFWCNCNCTTIVEHYQYRYGDVVRVFPAILYGISH